MRGVRGCGVNVFRKGGVKKWLLEGWGGMGRGWGGVPEGQVRWGVVEKGRKREKMRWGRVGEGRGWERGRLVGWVT